jgi:hypothetical protein
MDNILMMSIIFLSGTTGVALGAFIGMALSRRSATTAL